ncbi:hypothetical protein ACX1C1_13180 [Paenibacillus sp. strain BS8-2]
MISEILYGRGRHSNEGRSTLNIELRMKPIENVYSAVWLAIVILTYQRHYYSVGPVTSEDLAFSQQEIQRMASKLCSKTIHSPRISQWSNGDHPQSTYNYLRKVGKHHRRLTLTGEFRGVKEKPEWLTEADTIILFDKYTERPVFYSQLVSWLNSELAERYKASVS